MKNIITALALTILFGCGSEENSGEDHMVLSGQLNEIPESPFILRYKNDRSVVHTLEVDKEGTFRDTLQLPEGYYEIPVNRRYTLIYLEKGKDLHVSFNTNHASRIDSVGGKAAGINKYLLLKEEITLSGYPTGKELYSLGEGRFKEVLVQRADSIRRLLQHSENISESFKEREERNITYQYYASISGYENYHAYYTGKKEFKASAELKGELDALDRENYEDFQHLPSYNSLINTLVFKNTVKRMERDSTLDRYQVQLEECAKLKNEEIRNSLLFKNAEAPITYVSDPETFYNTFMQNSTDEEHRKIIQATYDQIKKTAPGNPSPQFTGYENHKGGTTSLADFKGKYVYIDIWATWCGPCLAEVPALKTLEKDYHGSNVEFVSISIDRKNAHDKWKELVSSKELKGVQLIADKDWDSDFVKDYMIKGIPRFILIGPQGEIIDPNAPRPSDEKIRSVFQELGL